MNAQELEKLIAKLKSADVKGWNTNNGNLNSACDPKDYWWPLLSTNLNSLSFMISKLVRGNAIRRVRDYSMTITIDGFTIDSYTESTSKEKDNNPLGNLYDTVYYNLKNVREKEFTERINAFLAENEQHGYKPQIEKIAAKLEELDLAQWRKTSYLDISTSFSTKANGLNFTLGTSATANVIKPDRIFHYLTIENYEEDFWIKYKNPNLKSTEEKVLCKLYNTLNRVLTPYYHTKFKEKIDDLLKE